MIFDFADVQTAAHLEDVHRDGIAGLGEGRAAGFDERDVAAARAGGAQGVGVHGGVGIVDLGQVLHAYRHRLGQVRFVGAGLWWAILVEGLDVGGEGIDEGVPFGLVGIAGWAQVLDGGEVGAPQHVQEQVTLTQGFLDVLALEDQAALGAAVGVIDTPARPNAVGGSGSSKARGNSRLEPRRGWCRVPGHRGRRVSGVSDRAAPRSGSARVRSWAMDCW